MEDFILHINCVIIVFSLFSKFYSKIELSIIFIGLPLFYAEFWILGRAIALDHQLEIITAVIGILSLAFLIFPSFVVLNKIINSRTYSREELIIAKKIYDSNYLANPEDFEDIKGTYEDAQVSIDYLLGIIDADSKKYKKVMYGTRKANQ